MITVAQARAERLGITNVRFRQIDAESIDQPAASLDGVLCRWGYMLMADGEAALRETRRILRPGGRVALAAWTGPSENPWASLPDARARRPRPHGAGPTPTRPASSRGRAPGSSRSGWTAPGSASTRSTSSTSSLRYPSFDDWIATQRDLASRFREALDGLDAAERDDVLATVREQAIPFVQEDGSLALPARTWVAAASA